MGPLLGRAKERLARFLDLAPGHGDAPHGEIRLDVSSVLGNFGEGFLGFIVHGQPHHALGHQDAGLVIVGFGIQISSTVLNCVLVLTQFGMDPHQQLPGRFQARIQLYCPGEFGPCTLEISRHEQG